MIKNLLKLIVFFFCLNLSAQAKFQKGYIINSQNEKIECLIKNRDWANSPAKLDYKLSENSDIQTIQADEINTFQIYNSAQYYKTFTVSIDRNLKKKEFNPEVDQLFLKVLVEGSASLYVSDDNIFFYQKDNGELKQLVYKEYENNDRKIKKDNLFRVELYAALKCNEDDAFKLRKVDYENDDLAGFFVQYNQCSKTDYVNYAKNKTPIKFEFKVFTEIFSNNFKTEVGVTTNSFSRASTKTVKVPSTSSNVALGAQFEVFLPVQNYKWAIIFSPNYQILKIEPATYSGRLAYQKVVIGAPSSGGEPGYVNAYKDFEFNSSYQYSFIELPLGLRHYFHLNATSKLYLDSSIGMILSLKEKYSEAVTTLNHDQNEPDVKLVELNKKASTIFRIGAGYSFGDKYSVGLNYYPQRHISFTNGQSFSVIATYKIL